MPFGEPLNSIAARPGKEKFIGSVKISFVKKSLTSPVFFYS